ncbi:hypothetical protein R3751_06445 [Halorubrum distributum]|uniref:hypothetical protein n=1 Tax=Halorubrum distributum TaxID=29283 RepID=UPI00295434DD|nr:hypothetical protein [Halorubrum distributum]MDV7349416.1 hypothetical protein [Halorubrum distributum]
MSETEKDDSDTDYVRLAETEATTTDEEGNARAKMETLSKGGEKESEEGESTDKE